VEDDQLNFLGPNKSKLRTIFTTTTYYKHIKRSHSSVTTAWLVDVVLVVLKVALVALLPSSLHIWRHWVGESFLS
jgi:hypothetical protein